MQFAQEPMLLPNSGWILTGPFNITWLKPTALFGLTLFDSVSHGVFYSLMVNLGCEGLVRHDTQTVSLSTRMNFVPRQNDPVARTSFGARGSPCRHGVRDGSTINLFWVLHLKGP